MRAAILGGDRRMIFCAKALRDRGVKVRLSCFEEMRDPPDIPQKQWKDNLLWCDLAVLPMPSEKDGRLFAPYSKTPPTLSQLDPLLQNKRVFCSKRERMKDFCGDVVDYLSDERFLMKNAMLTAEAAVALAVYETPRALFGAKVLVSGFGRIGKCLCRLLTPFGCNLTVAARKETDRALAQMWGIEAIDFSFGEKRDFDLIFNTVCAPVLNKDALNTIATQALMIDLASLPGGVDDSAAKDLGVRVIHALALPSRSSPVSAGAIIADTILENLGGSG